MTLKKDATESDVKALRVKTGAVEELGVDKAERSGSAALRTYSATATADSVTGAAELAVVNNQPVDNKG